MTDNPKICCGTLATCGQLRHQFWFCANKNGGTGGGAWVPWVSHSWWGSSHTPIHKYKFLYFWFPFSSANYNEGYWAFCESIGGSCQLGLLLTTALSCGMMGHSRPTVRTTDQSKARRLGGGTGFFSTHKLTTCTVWMAFLGNLGALKPPLCESQYACSLNSLNLFTVSLSQVTGMKTLTFSQVNWDKEHL